MILASSWWCCCSRCARVVPRLPGPLIVVALAAAVVALFSLQDAGSRLSATVPAGLPVPAIPGLSLADLAMLILPALGIAIVGYTDNVLTARAFAPQAGTNGSTPTRNGPHSARGTSHRRCSTASRSVAAQAGPRWALPSAAGPSCIPWSSWSWSC